ncbi:MAG: ABC transporter ATP-binding protein [Candidatus Muiribacteriota bacterium]
MNNKDRKKLIEVNDLKTYFFVEGQTAKAVDGVTFDIYEGETLGIVGESGSGKSVTSLSLLRLIPDPPGKIVNGEIKLKGQNLLDLSWEEIRKKRGNEISMIFQEPMTSLNPVFTIGMQVMEPILLHQGLTDEEAKKKAVEVLELVGIPDAEKRLDDYPHQFSGGMRQRVMIAMALVCNPSLLIADEPTTALDVTIQAQILDLMQDIKKKKQDSAILLITHDLAVISEMCDRVIVMYCGKIQEVADKYTLFDEPLHPYTIGLMESIPSLDTKKERLYTIPGNVPSIMNLPKGCSFSTRCSKKMDICEKEVPELIEVKPGHLVRCHLCGGKK